MSGSKIYLELLLDFIRGGGGFGPKLSVLRFNPDLFFRFYPVLFCGRIVSGILRLDSYTVFVGCDLVIVNILFQ